MEDETNKLRDDIENQKKVVEEKINNIIIECFYGILTFAKLIPSVKAATHLWATIAISRLSVYTNFFSRPKANPANI